MKITILNGNADPQNLEFDRFIEDLCQTWDQKGHPATHILLRDLDIKSCRGCFGCWVKTPGQCTFKDDSALVYRNFMCADTVILASPLIMGFPTALTKKVMEKCIPLIHPYADLVNGEVHHKARYAHYPVLGLLLQAEEDTDAEDIQIIRNIFQRTALNFKSRLVFTHLISEPREEILHEINTL